MYEENIEKIFNQDSRGKKRIGANVSKRASRRGYIRGGIRTQSDFLTPKQKRALNGEVKIVGNIYEDINKVPSWNEILKMEEQKQYELMKTLKSLHSSNALRLYFKIGTGTLYKLYENLGIHKPRGGRKPMTKKKLESKVYTDISQVPSFQEFLDMDRGTRIELLKQLRKDTSMEKLRKHWKISQGKLYKYLYDYGIVVRAVDENGKRNYIKGTKSPELSEMPILQAIEPVAEPEVVKEDNRIEQVIESLNNLLEIVKSNNEEVKNNFSITLNGIYGKEEVENKLLSLSSIMQDGKEYIFNLTITEK